MGYLCIVPYLTTIQSPVLVAPPKLWWSKISSHIARRHWAKLYHDNHKCGSLCNYKMVWIYILSVQFSAQLCPTLCIPMTCSMPSCPVHHQHLGFTQTHDHWVSDGIQPSHPWLSPSPPAFNLSQHQGLFKWVSSSHQVTTVLKF